MILNDILENQQERALAHAFRPCVENVSLTKVIQEQPMDNYRLTAVILNVKAPKKQGNRPLNLSRAIGTRTVATYHRLVLCR